MSKVFTITEGLENLGAMRTGGQGSVYKGRRTGHIITAVKLLPTPIHTESNDDKNFRDFQNEVQKLKKVNENPNPNVVKILNSGITDSGSFPFIEMEYIEGSDLEELLKPPHDPVFTIKETVKVAEQLANALAHCHKVGVRHGDIKSNNVKFNIHSGNYVLLDFGLSVMSDEQRRTSLRHAGAIEFMAPEQNEGQMLFQTDVYSFGVILYELLAGTVPFPLKDNGETSRNNVMLSHMETPVPDVLAERQKHIPQNWAEYKQEKEMQVPHWLTAVINKCLEKELVKRFKDGMELYEAISNGSITAVKNSQTNAVTSADTESEIKRLGALVTQYQQEAAEDKKEILSLREALSSTNTADEEGEISISKPVFIALILLLVSMGAFSAYNIFFDKNSNLNTPSTANADSVAFNDSVARADSAALPQKHVPAAVADTLQAIDGDPVNENPQNSEYDLQPADSVPATEGDTLTINSSSAAPTRRPATENDNTGKYKLAVQKAFFYSTPNESSRRNAFLVIWNNAELTAIDDKKGFIYVVFFNNSGQITKGWLRKKDLKQING